MNIQDRYREEVENEVEALAKDINTLLFDDESVKIYYHGWRVFFSPVIEKPKILIFGINPGNGQSGVEDFSFWDDTEIFEYTNPDYNFQLARETRTVFEMAGLTDVLKNSVVKTNYFFLSTTKEKDLYIITDFLGRNSSPDGKELLGDKLFRKSAEWSKSLIRIIQPRVVLCEGKSAYNNITDLFPDYGEHKWENHCGYTIIPNESIVIIGYSRFQSRIRNKEGLAELLRHFLK